MILNIRDPRDHIISLIRAAYGNTNNNTIIEALQKGGEMLYKATGTTIFYNYNSLSKCYDDFLKWKNYPATYITYYEKLVGPQAGGTQKEQAQEIINIANFLGITITEADAEKIGKLLYGNTESFRVGTIEQWKTIFNPEINAIFNVREKDLLAKLGYQ